MEKLYITTEHTQGLRSLKTADELINMSDPAEFHTSICYFDEAIVVHMAENNNSTGSFTGPAYGNSFVLDIDVEGDLQTATKAFIRIYKFLTARGIHTDCFFSGSKGYHIYIQKQYVEYPLELESKWHICMLVFAKWIAEQVEGVKDYIDYQIYTKIHNIRFPYSTHPKTNNRKTSFTFNEVFYTQDEVIDLNRTLLWNPNEKEQIKRRIFENELVMPDDFLPSIDITEYYDELRQGQPERTLQTDGKTMDVQNTFGKKLCILKMKEDKNIEGKRNAVILRLISWLKEDGFSIQEVSALIRAWNETLIAPIEDSVSNPELTKYIQRGFEAGYIYTCKDEIKMSYCTSSCYYFKTRNMDSGESVLKGGQMSTAVRNLQNMPQEGVINISLLWHGLKKANINPALGHVLTICAASGVGGYN